MRRLRLRERELHWREVDGEMIAVDARASAYLGANPSGLLIWEALADGATAAELAQLLATAFGIGADRARSDVDAFVAQLHERGLLEEA